MHDLARRRFHRHVVQRAKARAKLATEVEICGGVDIVGKRQRLIDGLDAKRLRLARVVDGAIVALVGAGQDLDEGGLARAVMAKQADDLTGEKADADVFDGLDAAERDGDFAHLDERRGRLVGAGPLVRRWGHGGLPYFILVR